MTEDEKMRRIESWYQDITLFLVGVAAGGVLVQLYKLVILIMRGVRWLS